jgi:hypothetical protein
MFVETPCAEYYDVVMRMLHPTLNKDPIQKKTTAASITLLHFLLLRTSPIKALPSSRRPLGGSKYFETVSVVLSAARFESSHRSCTNKNKTKNASMKMSHQFLVF